MKICKGCNEEKRITEFNYAVTNRDGRSCFCKHCQSKIKANYYVKNRDAINYRRVKLSIRKDMR